MAYWFSSLSDDREKELEALRPEFQERVGKQIPGVLWLSEEEQEKVFTLWRMVHDQTGLANDREDMYKDVKWYWEKTINEYERLAKEHRILSGKHARLKHAIYTTLGGNVEE